MVTPASGKEPDLAGLADLGKQLLDSLHAPLAERGWKKERPGEWARQLPSGNRARFSLSATPRAGQCTCIAYLNITIPSIATETDSLFGDLASLSIATVHASPRLKHPDNPMLRFTDEASAAQTGRQVLELVDGQVEDIVQLSEGAPESLRGEIDGKFALVRDLPTRAYLAGFVFGDPVRFGELLSQLRSSPNTAHHAIAERLDAVATERAIPVVEAPPYEPPSPELRPGERLADDHKFRTTLAELLQTLWVFGEDALVERLQRDGITPAQLSPVGRAYARWMLTEDPASTTGRGMPGDKALAFALVEVLEGEHRPLARQRRRSRDEAARRFPAPPGASSSVALW